MRGRLLLPGLLTAVVLAAPLASGAQQPGKVYRVALVFAGSPLSEMVGPDPVHPGARTIVHGLRALGYVEGQNLILERRSAEGKFERFPDIFQELVQLKMDVIVTTTNAPAACRTAGFTKPKLDAEGRPVLDSKGRPVTVAAVLFHDLRRSCVRNLERAGVSQAVAMKITGHKTASVYRRYRIVDETDMREALARVEAAASGQQPERKVVALGEARGAGA